MRDLISSDEARDREDGEKERHRREQGPRCEDELTDKDLEDVAGGDDGWTNGGGPPSGGGG